MISAHLHTFNSADDGKHKKCTSGIFFFQTSAKHSVATDSVMNGKKCHVFFVGACQ